MHPLTEAVERLLYAVRLSGLPDIADSVTQVIGHGRQSDGEIEDDGPGVPFDDSEQLDLALNAIDELLESKILMLEDSARILEGFGLRNPTLRLEELPADATDPAALRDALDQWRGVRSSIEEWLTPRTPGLGI